MPISALNVVRDALMELGAIGAADVPSAEDADLGLNKLNRLIDNWNAQREAIYAEDLIAFPITPGLGAHSIGPTGVWVVPQRPVKIVAASWTDPAATFAVPLPVRDLSWWQAVSAINLTADTPTDLAYSPEWPNGQVFLYPIPLIANLIVLEVWTVLAALTLVTTFSMPPGYQDAMTLTLAEDLSGPMRIALPPMTSQRAREARARIFALNDTPRPIRTRDDGMPGTTGGGFDFRLGY
jgi:hypothetical protein